MNWHDNELLMEHYDRIKRYIAYKAGIDQAEDLTQQVFLKANQSLNSFQNKSSLYTWLYSIASNIMMNEASRAYHTKELPVGHETNFSRFITSDFTKEVDFKIDLGTSFNKLDQLDREILTLRYIADYSFRDIAKLLKLNESAIKNRMYRCLGKMRNDLESWHIAAPFNPKQYINMVNMLETRQSGPEFQRVTDDFTAILRKNFQRITSALNFTPHTKIAYEIYPDRESMLPMLPEGHPSKKTSTGNFGKLNVVKIISPLNPGVDYHDIVRQSLSLYSMALTKQLSPQIPFFLVYGIGGYVGQEWPREQVRSRIITRYRQRELPSITYLRVADWLKFLEIGGIDLCYTLIDYIVTRYSWDALHRLLRDVGNLESIFERTLSQFEAEWKRFLMEQYMDDDACDSSGAVITSKQPSSKERSLTILIPNNDDGSLRYRISTFVECAENFKSANPGIEVNIATMPIPDFQGAKFRERISGAKAVDLVFWPYDSFFSRQGLFADLLHFYKEDGTIPDDLYKPLTDMVTENGQLTGIPMSPQPLAVFYNRDWFNRANLSEPTEDWTWEQFFAMSAHLKETNTARGKEIYGSAIPIIPGLFESLAQSNGGSMLSPDNSHFTGYLDSRPVIEVFALLLKNGQDVVKKVHNGTDAIIREISSGHVGMGVGVIGNYLFLARNPELKERVGVAPLPRLASGVRANTVWIEAALSIVAASKQQQLAWKFIKDIVLNPESEFQVDWSKQGMPASRSSIHKLKLNDEPGWKVFVDELNHAVKPLVYRNPKIKKIAAAKNMLNRLVSLRSEVEVQMELSRLASELDEWLDETNKHA
ncbi:extracellular solute-binding protein [Paenibacillus mesophilus]|uniref:extracellular solute-binding protein n=1 Tax=Paenibacillus mesophilus TaxID=2582849 RepID=UPI00110ED526|nr:extracellular solute-binding protein [Paenibacillus mesophilus]TMV49932.1 extracellular solute-binding protein [Paenibacillus mesophilus]